MSALQLGHFSAVEFFGNIEAVEQDGGVALGGVAIFFADDAFKFAELHTIFVGHVGFLVDRIAFLHGGPEALVAHDDGVDGGEGVEGILILAENADLAGTDDGAFLRLDFAAEQLHESGFAGAVGAGESIALAGGEGGGDFVEQNFGAVAHGNITDGKHD